MRSSTQSRTVVSAEATSLPHAGPGLSLPKVTRAHVLLAERHQLAEQGAQLLQEIVGALARELGCEISANGSTLPVKKDPAEARSVCTVWAVLDLPGSNEAALLELELDFAVSLVARLAGAPAVGPVTALTRLEESAFGYLCLVALRHPRIVEGWPAALAPRLRAVHVGQHPPAVKGAYLAVDVRLRVGGIHGCVRCWLPSRALQCVWRDLPAAGSQGESDTALLQSELPIRCSLGATRMASLELEALALRDVVLLDASRWSEGALLAHGKVWTSSFELAGSFGASGFEVRELQPQSSTQENTMIQSPDGEPSMALRIELEVELARRRIPLAQLAALKAGAILPLLVGVAEPVLLRVGDRVIATAELVDIEGEVGARILSLVR